MKVLAVDSSAKCVSAALVDGGKLMGEFYIDVDTTHSQTLMPMVNSLLDNSTTSLQDIDLFAVSHGPGSFTGVRIGVCAIKGLSYALNKPCIAISSLKSLAYSLIDKDCIAIASMDARRNQVYNAVFDIGNGNITRLVEDRAISIEDLSVEVTAEHKKLGKDIFLVGDGAVLCYNNFGKDDTRIRLVSGYSRFNKASSVAFLANSADKSEYLASRELMPLYLRLPQAQRELKLKNRKGDS